MLTVHRPGRVRRPGVLSIIIAAGLVGLAAMGVTQAQQSSDGRPSDTASMDGAARTDDRALDLKLARVLKEAGFGGAIESTLERRLGRPIDPKLADLGRLLWFDPLHSLRHDNTCGGCHSPTNGFGDSQGMAIGVQNNGVVGPGRRGARNQRRSPLVINTAFLSTLMWNGRFSAPSGDPFDNSLGFHFSPPEDDVRFPPASRVFRHLLQAQAHIPPTEMVEVAGFTGVCRPRDLGPSSPFCQFDDGLGGIVPLPDASGFRNEPIRQNALKLLNNEPEYRRLFGERFATVAKGFPIDFNMFGRAIAEFEFTLTFANAAIDRFARGQRDAMTNAEKRGALLFFGKAQCVLCHAVAGDSNEMFTDFKNRVVGVPQIAPYFGVGTGNVIFDGPGLDEDFGLEQITGITADRYKFRTAPLRNLAVAPAFFHNGAFTRLEDAINHHLRAFDSARTYDPIRAGVDQDLALRLGPIEPVLARIDPLLASLPQLTTAEFANLVVFVRNGLLDPRATRHSLCSLVPEAVPSGMPPLRFEECRQR
jgi:cytochrome c peroxidase